MGSLKQFVYTTSPAILLLLAIFDVVEAAPTVPEKSAEAWKNAADDSNGQWSRQQMYIMQRPPSAFGSLHQSMDSQASGMLMKGEHRRKFSISNSSPWLLGKNEATTINYEKGDNNAKSINVVSTSLLQQLSQSSPQQLRYFVVDTAPYDYYRRMGDTLQQYNSLNSLVDMEHPTTRNTHAADGDDGAHQKTQMLFSTRIQPLPHKHSTPFLQRLTMDGNQLIKRGGGPEPSGKHADGMDGFMNAVMLRGRRMESIHNCYFTPLQCHFLEQLK